MFKTIFVLIVLAFIIRILFIFQGGVSFHYDMARDAFEAREIWKDHNLKILGPSTSTPGLYHGVFYYYLIAPFYMLGQGDPRVVAIFLILINSLVVIPLVIMAKDIFKSKRWAYLAGALFVFSFEATQYAPWISNPAPAVLSVGLFFLSLYLWQKGKSYGLYLAVFLAAVSTQFQFFLSYLFILIPLFGMIFKIKTSLKTAGLSLLIAVLSLSSFLVAAIKFNTLGTIFLGFLNIGAAGPIDFRTQFAESILNYLNRFTEIFIFNFSPTNVFVGGILALAVLYAIRRERLLLFFLFSNLPIFIFGGHTNTYANVGLVVPAILAFTLFLRNIWKIDRKFVYIIIFLSLISNLVTISKVNPGGQVILVIPNDMNLKQELSLIDETYKIAAGEPFSINTLTLPLWTNTTWAYLYDWYGKSKYGYVPQFTGHNQIGLLGVNSLKKIDKPLTKTFLIIEPEEGIPPRFFNDELDTENSKTKLIKEITYGSIKLQVRSPNE
ncbi:hypothetical protein HYU45_02230 [Candidatus Daviesbacteria bacterium]|nr:hypothetical protein [Candidatus Daviesbacteria bacterium]